MTISARSPRVAPTAPRGAATTVGEVMRAGIVTCARSATVAEIARIMDACRTDCVVVLGNGPDSERFPAVCGLVTRDDLARPLGAGDPLATAEELTRTPAVRARFDLTIAEARSLCAAVGVSHLLVVDSGAGTPLGVVSDSELAFPPPHIHAPKKGTDHV